MMAKQTSTYEELARMLDGSEYPLRISADVLKQAQECGLVIVYGSSDDLMEFDGAICDEVGCYQGGTALIDEKGVLPCFADLAVDADKDALRDYFRREPNGKPIDALWCKEPGYSWTYKTAIPHATFEVMEDGENYCRGIVFALAHLKP